MKRKIFIPVASLVMMLASGIFAANAASTSMPDDDDYVELREGKHALPANARHFINTHFGTHAVRKVEKDDGKFEVVLRDGTELVFGRQGRCKKIEAGKNKIIAWRTANNLLPARARSIIAKRNLRNKIKSVSIKEEKIEVKFRGSKFKEIKFDRSGYVLDKDRHDGDRKEWREDRRDRDYDHDGWKKYRKVKKNRDDDDDDDRDDD